MALIVSCLLGWWFEVTVSSEDQAGLMARALADGASSFLRKPVAAELLLRAVRRLVGPPDQGVLSPT